LHDGCANQLPIIVRGRVHFCHHAQYVGTAVSSVNAEGRDTPREDSPNSTNSILYILRVDVVPGNDDYVLLPSNYIAIATVEKPMVARVVPIIRQDLGSLVRIVSVPRKKARGPDGDFANHSRRQGSPAFVNNLYVAVLNRTA
jgi:hypothetical protein